MPSYEDAHNRLANAVLILPIDYKNFIFGYCTHAGLRDFGGSLIGNIQERMEGKGKRGETFTALDLVSIIIGTIKKGIEINSPREETFHSITISPYLLDYLIEDESIRVLATILFNHISTTQLSVPLDKLDYGLSVVISKNVADLVNQILRKLRSLPMGMGSGTGLSENQSLTAYSVIYKAWGTVKSMGNFGVQELLAIINSDNRIQGVVASIILSVWESPSKNLIDEIHYLKPFTEFCGSGNKTMEIKIIGTLAERTLALCGDFEARGWVDNLCRRTGTTPDKWIFDVLDTTIVFVRDS